ncbi:MAG TPA: nucleotidyltransferase family protein [Chloroflexota bacterium]|nr:nucleotidyltransferase family protein [Chloroflexota bacterium]
MAEAHAAEVAERLAINRQAVTALCRRHHIARLALFGSVLRDDFRADSDVDMLVEFQPGRVPGYITLAGIALELERVVGRPVDLRTPNELSRYFRDDVLSRARPVYAAA